MPGTSQRIVISFTGTGRDQTAFPKNEFMSIASQDGANTVLFVSDLSRCWLNHPTMAEEIADVAEEVAQGMKAAEMVAIGNSMGASNALLMTQFLDFDAVVALSPQYSVDPSVLPHEHRWWPYRRNIAHYRFSAIDQLRNEGTPIFIFHGAHPNELQHAFRFPPSQITRQFIFPGIGHDLARQLKDREELVPLMELAMAGKPYRVRRLVERMGGMRINELMRDRTAV